MSIPVPVAPPPVAERVTGDHDVVIGNRGDSPFRPSTHGEMYWHNLHYNLDVYRYGDRTPVRRAVVAGVNRRMTQPFSVEALEKLGSWLR